MDEFIKRYEESVSGAELERCFAAVQQDGFALQLVPEDLITPELCLAAVKQNGFALAFVPEHLKTLELCLLALKQEPLIPLNQFLPKALMPLIALQRYSDTLPAEKELAIKQETSLDVTGRQVDFWEYEAAPEGDFVTLRTNDHELGVAAEYAWFRNKYPGAERRCQYYTRMKLNGTQIRCHILTIELPNGEKRNLYFDISQMTADLQAKTR